MIVSSSRDIIFVWYVLIVLSMVLGISLYEYVINNVMMGLFGSIIWYDIDRIRRDRCFYFIYYDRYIVRLLLMVLIEGLSIRVLIIELMIVICINGYL